jgi:hypothetical protein
MGASVDTVVGILAMLCMYGVCYYAWPAATTRGRKVLFVVVAVVFPITSWPFLVYAGLKARSARFERELAEEDE